MKRFVCLIALAIVCATASLHAQAFKPGEVIEYNAGGWPTKWERGVIESELPGGKQFLVRRKPSEFFPKGDTAAYSPEELRLPGAAKPAPAPLPGAKPQDKAAVASAKADDGPPMSQDEILAWLHARIGSDPWRHPDKPRAVSELAALIRQRGANFRWDTMSEFATKLTNSGGNESTIPFAIQANFGPPAQAGWFPGKWSMIKIGAATRFEKGGTLYERLETGANAGTLIIAQDGTYDWSSASGRFRGSWRAATVDEMAVNYQGGAGLVLLKAKGGWDWIISRSTNPEFKGDSIDLKELTSRQIIEYGGRL